MIGPFKRRAIRDAYVEGVIDFVRHGRPDSGARSEIKLARTLDQVQRLGFEQARAGRPLYDHEFVAEHVVQSAFDFDQATKPRRSSR